MSRNPHSEVSITLLGPNAAPKTGLCLLCSLRSQSYKYIATCHCVPCPGVVSGAELHGLVPLATTLNVLHGLPNTGFKQFKHEATSWDFDGFCATSLQGFHHHLLKSNRFFSVRSLRVFQVSRAKSKGFPRQKLGFYLLHHLGFGAVPLRLRTNSKLQYHQPLRVFSVWIQRFSHTYLTLSHGPFSQTLRKSSSQGPLHLAPFITEHFEQCRIEQDLYDCLVDFHGRGQGLAAE